MTEDQSLEAPPAVPIRWAPSGTRGELEINGVDISKEVSRISVDHRAGDFPRVFLELKPGGTLDPVVADASVFIREVVQEDPADAMLRFIEPLDPSEFEKACLASMEMGGPATFGEAALAVLRSYARGD